MYICRMHKLRERVMSFGGGGCKHSHSTCCYVMMSYCSYENAKLASWLNEHHYYPLQIGVFV